MKTKILLLFAWLMATATGCSADESRKDLSDMPPAEKPEEPAAPAGNRKAQIVYFVQMSIVRRLRHAAKTCWIRTNDMFRPCSISAEHAE